MSFFDDVKNAGKVLLLVALLSIILTVLVVFAFDDYKDADMWKKIVMIVGSIVGALIYAVLGLDIINGKCRVQMGNLFSDVGSKFGVLVAMTAVFGISEIVSSIFSIIAFGGAGEIGQIVVGVLFILMAYLLAGDSADARKVVWIILLILYIIMLIFSILAALVLIGIPVLLLSIFLVTFMLSPEVKEKCGM